MGLQREIEEVFRRVLRQDLARISRLAQPSYHVIPCTPPPGTYYNVQDPSSGGGSIRVVLAPTDYVVKHLKLDPLELRDMDKIKVRRARRGDLKPDSPFDRVPSSDPDDQRLDPKADAAKLKDRNARRSAAFHTLHEELGWTASPVETRQIDIDETQRPPVVRVHTMIRLAGVDYVLASDPDVDPDRTKPEDMVGQSRWDEVSGTIDIPHGRALDGWPELILLPPLRQGGKRRVFVRGDIAAIGKK